MEKCRNCGKKHTVDRISFYGGAVCSEPCKDAVVQAMEISIDQHADPLGYYRAKAERNDPYD